jgi:hypothetical protein
MYTHIVKLGNNNFFLGKSYIKKLNKETVLTIFDSEWLRNYKIISVKSEKIGHNSSFKDICNRYIKKYGIKNVKYEKPLITEEEEIFEEEDYDEVICERCFRKGHLEEDCYSTRDVNGDIITNLY